MPCSLFNYISLLFLFLGLVGVEYRLVTGSESVILASCSFSVFLHFHCSHHCSSIQQCHYMLAQISPFLSTLPVPFPNFLLPRHPWTYLFHWHSLLAWEIYKNGWLHLSFVLCFIVLLFYLAVNLSTCSLTHTHTVIFWHVSYVQNQNLKLEIQRCECL